MLEERFRHFLQVNSAVWLVVYSLHFISDPLSDKGTFFRTFFSLQPPLDLLHANTLDT